MSLKAAIEILRPRLSEALQASIADALKQSISQSKLSVPFFSIWLVPSFEGFRHTNERRLIGCSNAIKEKCIRDRLELMKESLAAGSTHHLWAGYIINEPEHNFFLLDETRKTFCIGQYP